MTGSHPACRRILCPTDFSDASDAALEVATALARDCGGKLIIAHVAAPSGAGGQRARDLHSEDSLALHRLLDEVRPPDPRVPFETRLVRGDPAVALAELVEREAIDLIVMAARRRGGLSKLVLGSVATAVLRTAVCPVLTLRTSSLGAAVAL
jgi:nucleotide-binding universal stress UspA family protein